MDTAVISNSLADICRELEAYQTPRWAIESVLDVELTTRSILDPCAGLGAIGEVCRERGLDVDECDIEDWRVLTPHLCKVGPKFWQQDFLRLREILTDRTVIMNPPFSLAEEFVSYSLSLNARKVICFQRQAWRESVSRRLWWESNAPARVWVCGSCATCWRFDLVEQKGDKGGSSVSMAWYVWEHGHKAAEVTSAIYPARAA